MTVNTHEHCTILRSASQLFVAGHDLAFLMSATTKTIPSDAMGLHIPCSLKGTRERVKRESVGILMCAK